MAQLGFLLFEYVEQMHYLKHGIIKITIEFGFVFLSPRKMFLVFV